MTVKKEILVAVYGSLRKDLGNSHYLKDQEFVGQFDTLPIYSMHSLGSFPGLLKNGVTSVVMEVYKVNQLCLSKIDSLEGYSESSCSNNYYEREEIITPYGKAYTYFYNTGSSNSLGNSSLVKNGDWKEFKKLSKIKNYV